MFGILARLLEILYSIWPSYGGSIVLFTIVVMLILAPLTFKSTRSMLAMQALQPEMKKLQNRYKDDRQKLNEEMMKFYQENKISPLGGCLPMLIQLPVFFILYAVLLGLTRRGPFGGDLGHSVACSMGGTNACVDKVGTFMNAGFFHPAYLKESSKLFQDLSATRVMNSFGLDLSQSAWAEFGQGLLHALPYILMVLFVMGLTYLQQQQIQSRQPKKDDQNPTQQMMMKIMPIAMGFIYIIIPAGVVVYFLVSSLFRIGQQAMVTRTFYTGPNAIVIPTTATETGGTTERKSFWDQFKPSEGSLPQVGKKAKAQRAESLGASRQSKAADDSPRSAGAKSKGASASKGASGGQKKASSGQKSSSNNQRRKRTTAGTGPTTTGRAQNGGKTQKRSAGSAGAKGRTGVPDRSERAERPATERSSSERANRPSRKAPSRNAPPRPSNPKKSSGR